MEVLFENKTQYTKELYDEYLDFHTKKYGIKELVWYIVGIIALIAISILGFPVLKWKVAAIWIIVLLMIFVYTREGKQTKKQYNIVIGRKRDFIVYKFYDRYFETNYNGEESKLYYIEIKKVYELEDRYYMYLNKKYAFILMKDGFSKGTDKEFREFIDTKGLFRIVNVKNQ